MDTLPENPNNTSIQQTIRVMAIKVDEIYDCLFGSPSRPRSGLFHEVDLNSRFRHTVIKVLFALVPTVIYLLIESFKIKFGGPK